MHRATSTVTKQLRVRRYVIARESALGSRKKQCTHCAQYDAIVTLTDGDLEQIVDTVTLAMEDKWAFFEA